MGYQSEAPESVPAFQGEDTETSAEDGEDGFPHDHDSTAETGDDLGEA